MRPGHVIPSLYMGYSSNYLGSSVVGSLGSGLFLTVTERLTVVKFVYSISISAVIGW